MNSDSTISETQHPTPHIFSNVSVDIHTLPKAEEVQFTGISPKYMIVQHAYSVLLGLGVGVIGAASFIGLEGPKYVVPLVGLGCLLLLFFVRFFVIRLAFPWKGYAVREKDVIYRSGLIWRKVIVIPYSRIQHGELSEGLMERQLKLRKLRLYTAGGSSSDLTIPGLMGDNAERLRDHIMKRVIEEAEDIADEQPAGPGNTTSAE